MNKVEHYPVSGTLEQIEQFLMNKNEDFISGDAFFDLITDNQGIIDDEGYIDFGEHFVLVPEKIATALRKTQHRIIQFEPLVIDCDCYSGCHIQLEIHDNGDLVMIDGLIQETVNAGAIATCAAYDAFHESNT